MVLPWALYVLCDLQCSSANRRSIHVRVYKATNIRRSSILQIAQKLATVYTPGDFPPQLPSGVHLKNSLYDNICGAGLCRCHPVPAFPVHPAAENVGLPEERLCWEWFRLKRRVAIVLWGVDSNRDPAQNWNSLRLLRLHALQKVHQGEGHDQDQFLLWCAGQEAEKWIGGPWEIDSCLKHHERAGRG